MNKKNAFKFLPVFAFVCMAVAVYWGCFYGRPLIGIDDANNYFVYMRNLAAGQGFVYNAGGEHVEGFTSLAWTLIGSVFYKISLHPQLCLLFFNVLIISVVLWQLILFIDAYFDDRRLLSPYSFFLLGALFLIPGYFEWTVLTIMETGLWSCLLITLTLNLCYLEMDMTKAKALNRWFSLWLVLLVLARPESYLWGPVFLALRFWQLRRQDKNFTTSLKRISLPVFCLTGTVAVLTAWRLSYFGFPFPNTYYDKVSTDHLYNLGEGIRYVAIGFMRNYLFSVVALIFIVLFAVKIFRTKSFDSRANVFLILVASIVTSFAIPLYTGGDHFRLARLIQPVMPLFYFAFMIAITDYYRLKISLTKNYLKISLLLILAMLTPSLTYNLVNYLDGIVPAIKVEFELAEKGKNTATKMSSFFKEMHPLPTHGVLCAGGLAYYYDGITIDLMGLNNVAMAHANPVKIGTKNHAAFDKETFYKLAPDISFTASFVPDTSAFVLEENTKDYDNDSFSLAVLYKNIFKEDRFRGSYFPVFIFRRDEKECLHTYANEDFLNRLDTSVYAYKIIKR